MVDDFALSSEKPTPGAWHFLLTLGELPPMPITLCAAADDLRKIKEWMEAIARDERHCSVVFGSGAGLCCDITDIPESAVIKTYRFLDEQFPSPIARVTQRMITGTTVPPFSRLNTSSTICISRFSVCPIAAPRR